MKGKRLLGCFGLIAVVCGGVALLKVAADRKEAAKDEAALEEQLRLAHAEGMPTTWAEYAAGIKTAIPEENAAPFYRKLKSKPADHTDLNKLIAALDLHPISSVIAEAKAELNLQKDAVDAVDQATKMPHCWFDRDWTKGPAVLMPELAWMKYGAKLIALRGTVAANEGRPSDAVRDIDEVLKVGIHANEEGTAISEFVDDAVYMIGLHQLELWLFKHPQVLEYRNVLVQTIAKWPRVDLKWIHRDDLISMMAVLKMSTTAKGRSELGLKEGEESGLENVLPLFMSRSKADVIFAKGMRKVWEAYGSPPKFRLEKMNAAWSLMTPAMIAYPTGSDIYSKLTDLGEGDHYMYLYDQVWEARRLTNVALMRAIGAESIPKAVKTNDLLSPFDGKPLEYKYDGRQITIKLSCPDKDINFPELKFPTDKELNPVAKPS